MDLAKVFATWRNQPPEQWLALVNKVVPPVAVVALVIFLAFQAAGLTWRMLEQPTRQEDVPPAVLVTMADTPRSGRSANRSMLSDWSPFGDEPDPGLAQINPGDFENIEETQLDLVLHGVNQYQALPEPGSDDLITPEAGSAIISMSGGTQVTYHTGDQIGTTNVTLHSVFVDRVMLDPGNGNLEKLSWPEVAQSAQSRSAGGSNRSAPAPFRAPQPNATPAATVEAVTGAAAIFGRHIQVRQALEGDQAIGFRLEPINDSPVMSRLGLERGDVLTEVNGVRLGDLRSTTAVLQALQQSPQANIKLRRNGVEQAMVIDMSQVARLAESVQ